MKKTIKIAATLALLLCTPYFNMNTVKAENNLQECSGTIDIPGSGTILSLDFGAKSGFMQDDITGDVYKFVYAGLETLEVSADYVYIVQITASGKIIIRDIHRK